MKPKPITASQQKVIDAIRSLTEANGYPPTIREIMRACGWTSLNNVKEQLGRLQRRGVVTWEPKLSRTLRVLEQEAQS